MGGLWRLYYGGTFGQRLLGKFGPVIALMAFLAANLWFASSNPYTTLLAIPMGLLWWQGFRWASWLHMSYRFTMYTIPIAGAWAWLEGDWVLLAYGLSGLTGLAYPVGNRIQPTPWLGYTQWAELITGIAMVDSVVLMAWLT